ncbi:MAG TPA: TlpA disulfide reductase family protein [Gammaproteobacteria bacterium]|nr:TlpA disulfide reductase family protein [Gammaproteobacteria bacterium]
MSWRLLATITLAALLGAAAGVGGYLYYEARQRHAEAELRPAFQLPDLNDQLQSVAQWDGKVVVLNFWATWCPPCVREVPMLVALQNELGQRGLQVIGIAVDKRDIARDFAQEAGVNYPILYGVQSALEVSQLYGNDAGTLPHTAIIDRRGIIRHIIRGELEREQLEAVVLPLL